MPKVPKSVYLVAGWKHDPKRGLTLAFHVPTSSTPGEDVERALGLRCFSVNVWLLGGENFEEQGRNYIEGFLRVTHGGSYYEPPVWRGPTTCNIIGSVPDGKTPQGRVLFSTRFGKDDSTTPSEDVERALTEGSTDVAIEVTKWGTPPRSLR